MKYNGENYMNIRFLSQIVLQVTGLIYATVKYRNKNIEHIDDYVSGIKYSLPLTVNGTPQMAVLPKTLLIHGKFFHSGSPMILLL